VLIGTALWWNMPEAIIAHAKEGTTDCRNVVGFGRVGQPKVATEGNAILGEGSEFCLEEG
jgi:hypothetical protein